VYNIRQRDVIDFVACQLNVGWNSSVGKAFTCKKN